MRTIATDAAPKAIGPYSQAIVTDGLVFSAGQVALDPRSGELVGKTTAEQTEQVLQNLKAVLAAAGTSLDNVVKTTVYLADMADFAQMNEVYAKHFGTHKPAGAAMRSTPPRATAGSPWPAISRTSGSARPWWRRPSSSSAGSTCSSTPPASWSAVRGERR